MEIFGFLTAFWSGWFSLMSGGLSVPLAIAAFFVHNTTAKKWLAGTAVLCFVAASYVVWQSEHDAKGKAEERIAALENRYPYSLNLSDVQSTEERTSDPNIKFGFLSRKMQFKLLWANTIDTVIAYQMERVVIDGKNIPVPHATYTISGRSPGQFYIPSVEAPLRPAAREVHTVELKYRYGEPDRMRRCVDRTIRYEITFLPGGGVAWVEPSAAKDIPCQ